MTHTPNANIEDAMIRALESPAGVRLWFPRRREPAFTARSICYKIRAKRQRRSREMFHPSDPSFGRTPYDGLTFSVDGPIDRPDADGNPVPHWCLTIANSVINNFTIEEITLGE